ncbi:hypothetical protein BDP27DRAFT_1441958 [Rhodocollybia butyracea]|uniref:AB hydrolase-1 domain-containing protein n=1 Tax=Rhodocollybia butyracea TaxID=206335 RepID=A0A9P5UFG1_9AGAR|nr:hypothetical protein BDP27DRAFT_1441958 [Rhodocollybia butyracea]
MAIQFLIVPGAWHPAQAYFLLADTLQKHGFKASIAAYPSLNPPNPADVSVAKDTAAVRLLLRSVLSGEQDQGNHDEGVKVVVVNHSFGGMIGCAAAYGEHVAGRRERGEKGGVIGIINIAGFTGIEGMSMMQGTGKHADYVRLDKPTLGLCEVENPKEVFFHDVDDDLAQKTIKSLLPHALHVFETAPGPSAATEAAFEGRLAFLKTTEDKALLLRHRIILWV